MIPRVLDRMGNAVLVEVVRIIQEGTGIFYPDTGAACILCQRPRARVIKTEGKIRFHLCGHCSLRFRSVERGGKIRDLKVIFVDPDIEEPEPEPTPKKKKK